MTFEDKLTGERTGSSEPPPKVRQNRLHTVNSVAARALLDVAQATARDPAELEEFLGFKRAGPPRLK